MRRAGAPLLAACVAFAGCGSSSHHASTTPTTATVAQLYGERTLGAAQVPHPTAKDYAQPIAQYRRYVARQLDGMKGDVARLAAAGSLDAARSAWLDASARYESIGAAYGAFGALDAAINGRPGNLTGGVTSPKFVGLHRIEYALWKQGSTADAAPYIRRLASDVGRLRARIGTIEIDPLDYGLRAHEVLEDSLQLQLSGDAAPWSSSALNALKANVAGTRFVLQTLTPMITKRDTEGLLGASERAVERVRDELRSVQHDAGGTLPRWDATPPAAKEKIAALTGAAAEQLAYVPSLISPLKKRPLQAGTE